MVLVMRPVKTMLTFVGLAVINLLSPGSSFQVETGIIGC
jgi:hypothetical protein